MFYYSKIYGRLHLPFFLFLSLLLPYVLQGALANIVLGGWQRTLFVVTCWLVLWILAYSTSHKALIKRLTKHHLSLYINDCDPEKFLHSSTHILKKIKRPYTLWNVWHLSYCCLAAYDIGDELGAKKILQTILDDTAETKGEYVKAQKELQLFSPVSALMDYKLALEYLEDAEAFFSQKPKKYAQDLLYISFQRMLWYTKEIGEPHAIISAWRQRGDYEDSPLRTKVIAAYEQSKQYQKLDNIEKERELLDYVVSNGRNLLVGKKALERLGALPGKLDASRVDTVEKGEAQSR